MATVTEVLSLLRGVEEHDGYWTALCPAHEDKTASLSVTEAADGKVLLKCHAGCTEHGPAKVCHALGKPVAWLFPDHGLSRDDQKAYAKRPKGQLVATFDYRDAEGALVFQSQRFETDSDKTFRQRRPDGDGGWIYSMKGVKRVLYRLPELIKSHKSEPVFIVEGERKADKLAELGFIATCNSGGASNKWNKNWSAAFTGRDVIILPDNDEPGQKYAANAYECIKDAANSVRQVTLPNLPKGGDIIDWIAAGGTAEQLKSLIDAEAAPVATAPKREVTHPADDEVVERLLLDVFGEDEDGRIKVYSEHHRKTVMIRDIDKLTRTKLIQICGPHVREVITDSRDETPEGMFRVKDAKEAIASIAGKRRLEEQVELGVGIWEGGDGEDKKNAVVLVNAGEAAILNHHPGLQKLEKPRFGEQLLDLGTSDPWFNFDVLAKRIDDYSPEWAREVVEELETIFSQWWFGEERQQLMPALLSGLVLATWTQTIWRWRPQVFILGKSNSGKSKMFEFLAGDGSTTRGLFGRLVVSSVDATAAGISQTVGHSAKAIVLDEVENSRKRGGVFEMLRGSGRGGKSLRGTAHQKSISTGLRHIVWAAATESGLKKEVDANRFIVVNLGIPPADTMGKLKIPDEIDTCNLGQKLMAVAVKTALAARDLSERLKESRPAYHHYRVVESYSVPAAAYAKAVGMSDSDAESILGAFLSVTDPSEIESDEQRIFDAILQSKITIVGGKCETIGQAVYWRDSAEANLERRHALEAVGIVPMKRFDDRELWIEGEDECVFVVCSAVEQNVLSKHDEWRGAKLMELLSRLPKAVKARKRSSGKHSRGVLLPIGLFVEKEDF